MSRCRPICCLRRYGSGGREKGRSVDGCSRPTARPADHLHVIASLRCGEAGVSNYAFLSARSSLRHAAVGRIFDWRHPGRLLGQEVSRQWRSAMRVRRRSRRRELELFQPDLEDCAVMAHLPEAVTAFAGMEWHLLPALPSGFG